MEESDPHAEAEPPTLGPQLCSSPSGPERLEQDVSKLLDAFIAGGQCDDVLKALPLFISKDGRSHSLHESEAKMEQYIKTACSHTEREKEREREREREREEKRRRAEEEKKEKKERKRRKREREKDEQRE